MAVKQHSDRKMQAFSESGKFLNKKIFFLKGKSRVLVLSSCLPLVLLKFPIGGHWLSREYDFFHRKDAKKRKEKMHERGREQIVEAC